MSVSRIKQIVVNGFGTLGYISLIIQWAWLLVVIGYPIMLAHPHLLSHRSDSADRFNVAFDFGSLTPLVTWTLFAITALVMALTIISLVKAPKAIGAQGARLTRKGAKTMTPLVVHHHAHISKKKALALSYRLVMAIKCGLLLAPVILTIFAHQIGNLSLLVIWSATIFCASWTLMYFLVQYALAWLLHVKPQEVW